MTGPGEPIHCDGESASGSSRQVLSAPNDTGKPLDCKPSNGEGPPVNRLPRGSQPTVMIATLRLVIFCK